MVHVQAVRTIMNDLMLLQKGYLYGILNQSKAKQIQINMNDLVAQIGRARVCSFGNASIYDSSSLTSISLRFERIPIVEQIMHQCVYYNISSDLHDQHRNLVIWHL